MISKSDLEYVLEAGFFVREALEKLQYSKWLRAF